MNIPNGVTANTIENIQVDTCIIRTAPYEGDTNDGNTLCSTSGGASFSFTAQEKNFAIDGIHENTVGNTWVYGATASLKFKTLEQKADLIKLAIGLCDETTDSNGIKTIVPKLGIKRATDYKDIYAIGFKSNGEMVEIKLSKATNKTGLSNSYSDKGEVTTDFDLQPNFDLLDQDTVPCAIRIIPNGAYSQV